MSRSGYTDECEYNWQLIMFRGRVASATRGKRGQAMLKDLLSALDAMPEKRLIKNNFVAEGEFCTLGVLGAKRGINMSGFMDGGDDEWDGYCDRNAIADAFNVATPLVQEIMHENDECIWNDEIRHEVDLIGPVRPGYPDWGRKTITYYTPDPTAPARRWQHMRDWIAKQIKDES